jgi:hypothetical protein
MDERQKGVAIVVILVLVLVVALVLAPREYLNAILCGGVVPGVAVGLLVAVVWLLRRHASGDR